MDFDDSRRRLWRWKNESFTDCCVVEHDEFGGVSVLAWGDISCNGSTYLYVIQNRSLTDLRYRNKILDPIVRPYLRAICDDFIV